MISVHLAQDVGYRLLRVEGGLDHEAGRQPDADEGVRVLAQRLP